ncbi:MAG: hypothetical protein WC261_10290 [Synergistaceae bacterium]|jgi:glutamate synthase domain-containing protein 3
MKTKEEILDEKTEDWNLTMSSASRVIALEAMEEYADEVTLGKTLQIHARDQQTEKYKELIEAYKELDNILSIMPNDIDNVISKQVKHYEIRNKIEQLKTELGL